VLRSNNVHLKPVPPYLLLSFRRKIMVNSAARRPIGLLLLIAAGSVLAALAGLTISSSRITAQSADAPKRVF
jgi:hypothetical protein